MNRRIIIAVCFVWTWAVVACYSDEPLSLEPKDNTWELDVELLQVGIIENRSLQALHGPDKDDPLKETLGWDDLPEKKRSDADRNKIMNLPKTTADRYMYFVFTLQNLTKKPVIDPATQLPKVDEKNNVIYRYVKINTRKVIPDTTYLNVRKTKEKLSTKVSIFFEIDPEGQMAEDGLWYRRTSAIDIRLENKMSPEERARYATNLPYLHQFLVKTADYDLVKGDNTLPEIMDAHQKIRGVAFFAGVPEDIDQFNLYFAGISNRYRVKRLAKRKTGFFLKMVEFSFSETGDELEITKDFLDLLEKRHVYRPQYMGIYNKTRRIKNWNEELRRIRELGMSDPVEKWETQQETK
jgi:hypothetical protein